MLKKKYVQRSPIIFPTNVQIVQKSSDGTLIKITTAKNMVLKQYGLYSWVRFILGAFGASTDTISEGTAFDKSIYSTFIPKYLAVGKNVLNADGSRNGALNVNTTVNIEDTSLYNEIFLDKSLFKEKRKKIDRGSYIENIVTDVKDQNFLKIQYEINIAEDEWSDTDIGELALMTEESGYNAFARVTFPQIHKDKNTVLQIIWEITIVSIESTVRFEQVSKTSLKEAIEKSINILADATSIAKNTDGSIIDGSREALDKLIEPSSNTNTGMYYLLSNDPNISQNDINNFLSKPYISINDTGLIPLINKFDPDWN